ncbi:TraB/GumN family protein [Enterovibrio nigricans]|uniref:TraB family protein n=1 Tax=Enterovibrio nigricans DSM 22720 TaxID=1121868 RepID=A0A1T4U3Q7_9GAMM|nr:TraB/GumN family protein [Enterovibrio nigricans]PKF51852.1 TraB/GumN family protein [Enterovibrio nigricans]SKA47385.1 hypothetical protein SAMN02745132_00720 [Enterovibrio nigricans DSM 22720]
MIKRLVPLLSLLFFSNVAAEPTVWLAKKGDLSFALMGSVHMGKPSFYPLPDEIIHHFQRSKGLIVEADLFSDTNISIPTGQASQTFLNATEQHTLNDIAKDVHLPSLALQNMPPWQAAMAIQQAQTSQMGLQPQLGIDVHFLTLAQEKNIPIIALETMQQQLNFITSMKDDGLPLLLDTLNHWEEAQTVLPCMIDAWAAGDSQALTDIVEDMMEDSGELEEVIITDRNRHWTETLSDTRKFGNGTYTIVVGALHLYGQEGLLDMLKNKGFEVRALNKGHSVECVNTLPK